MPPVFRDAVILPIPKGGNTDLFLALAPCFSKLLEYCILEDFGSCLLSSHLQFGFKPVLSTMLCTGVLKATIPVIFQVDLVCMAALLMPPRPLTLLTIICF